MTQRPSKPSATKTAFSQKITVWVNENGTALFFKAVMWIIATLLAVTCYFLTGYFHKAEKAGDKMESFSESVGQFKEAVTELKFVVQEVKQDNADLKIRMTKLEDWKEHHEQERTKFFQDYELKKKQ